MLIPNAYVVTQLCPNKSLVVGFLEVPQGVSICRDPKRSELTREVLTLVDVDHKVVHWIVPNVLSREVIAVVWILSVLRPSLRQAKPSVLPRALFCPYNTSLSSLYFRTHLSKPDTIVDLIYPSDT